MTADMSPSDASFVIPAALDFAGAPDVAGRLVEALGDDSAPLALEIGGPEPTQVALQLLFATLKEARAKGLDVELGDHARALTSRVAGAAWAQERGT